MCCSVSYVTNNPELAWWWLGVYQCSLPIFVSCGFRHRTEGNNTTNTVDHDIFCKPCLCPFYWFMYFVFLLPPLFNAAEYTIGMQCGQFSNSDLHLGFQWAGAVFRNLLTAGICRPGYRVLDFSPITCLRTGLNTYRWSRQPCMRKTANSVLMSRDCFFSVKKKYSLTLYHGGALLWNEPRQCHHVPNFPAFFESGILVEASSLKVVCFSLLQWFLAFATICQYSTVCVFLWQ